MTVQTRSATVSTFDSGYDGPLATDGSLEQHAADNGICQLSQGYQKTADWIQCEKCSIWLHFQPLKYQKKYSFSYLRQKLFLTFVTPVQ